MIWYLIAAFSAGLAAAGIALILRKISGQRLPKWIVPAFAGIGMLSYQINIEYSWFEHKLEKLPEGSVVISTEAPGSIWRPWTYFVPMTSSFTVLDTAGLNTRPVGDHRVAEFALYRFEKQFTDQVAKQFFVLNCNTREMLPVTDKGSLNLEAKQILTSADPLLERACDR